MIVIPARAPARSYAESLERLTTLARLDGDEILDVARTKWHVCGRATELAVVLLHGFTNNPAQYASFAPMLHARGVNVVIPRMPLHGHHDRMTSAIAALTAQALVATVSETLDIACGLGKTVGILGISMGGALAAFFAHYRALAIAVPVAPDFALLDLPYGASRALGWSMARLPNLFLWWDPRERTQHVPLNAYPRFSTRALGRSMAIGDAVMTAARREPQSAERIVTVVNRLDPAVNNAVTAGLMREWRRWKPGGVDSIELCELPRNHDIISPDDPLARTDLVYPALLRTLGV